MPKWGKNTDFEEFGEVVKTPKTVLELRTSGDSCGEGRGETFPLLFRLLADFVGISRLRLKTANGGTGSARFAQKKNRTPIGVLFFFGAENGT